MSYSSKSPQEKRGGSQQVPKHGESVQTTQTSPREERPGDRIGSGATVCLSKILQTRSSMFGPA
jgi:hypothetical protein